MTPEQRAALFRMEAVMLEARAAHMRLGAAAILATAHIGRFVLAVRRAEEATFLDMVVRFDEDAALS